MAATPASNGIASSIWVRRARLAAAVVLLWAGLHFVVGAALLPAGLDRPVMLAASGIPILVGLAVTVWLWLGAYVGALIAGARSRMQGLLVVALALAAWPVGRGTMDDWLLLSARDGLVQPPTPAAYWPLVAEYVFLAVLMAGAAAISTLAAPPGDHAASHTLAARFRRTFALDADRHERRRGLAALLIVTAITGVLMLLLTGPAPGNTQRGQIYFAIAVASAAGVFAATRMVAVRHSIWFWPAPILVGLIGVLVAALKPDLLLDPGYNQLNSIPAWGLARPLPMEMVGVGVAVCLWTVRAARAKRRSNEPGPEPT